MDIERDCLEVTRNVFSLMWLIVEGAIVLFENDAEPITRLIQDTGKDEAYAAFDTIGRALYDLRQHVKELEPTSRQATVAHER